LTVNAAQRLTAAKNTKGKQLANIKVHTPEATSTPSDVRMIALRVAKHTRDRILHCQLWLTQNSSDHREVIVHSDGAAGDLPLKPVKLSDRRWPQAGSAELL
jgi:hypothetical protein